jgi:hypothetical protein
VDKTLKTVIAAALIAASSILPSFSFAQNGWIARVEGAMRRALPKEAKCIRTMMSICKYETPKFKLTLTGSFDDAGAILEVTSPLTQEEADAVFKLMLFGFLKEFNFDESAIRNCIGGGRQRNQWSPEQVKSTDKEFKLKCYGSWFVTVQTNNEF